MGSGTMVTGCRAASGAFAVPGEKNQTTERKLEDRQPEATAAGTAIALPSDPLRPSGLPPLRRNVPLVEQIRRPAVPIRSLILPVPAESPGTPNRKLFSSATRRTWQKPARRETEVMCIGCRNLFLTGRPFDKHVKKCKPLRRTVLIMGSCPGRAGSGP